MKNIKSIMLTLILAFLFCFTSLIPVAYACTGITLTAEDETIVYGRTMEWGAFDLESEILIIPKGHKFQADLSNNENEKSYFLPGKKWTSDYGVVGINGLHKPFILDGMNEKGLAAGVFYHPGFAEYQKYDPDRAYKSVGPSDVVTYLLSTCATVDEVRNKINGKKVEEIVVINVVEPALQIAPPIHLMVSDPSGEQIVIEWSQGEAQIFDAELGVITNAPTYDWHITNLRNYVNLSAVGLPDEEIGSIDFSPLGAGSGMIGIPGDFTPPSRFIRAVAFTQTARPTTDGPETMYELFRILDNFNVPLPPQKPTGPQTLPLDETEEIDTSDLRSATLWTTAHDLKNKVIYYHTQHNRQIRKIDVGSLNFGTIISSDIQVFPLDKDKEQNIEDRTPREKSISS